MHNCKENPVSNIIAPRNRNSSNKKLIRRGITKVPTPEPAVAMPTANPRCLLKYCPTITKPGTYARAFPKPGMN